MNGNISSVHIYIILIVRMFLTLSVRVNIHNRDKSYLAPDAQPLCTSTILDILYMSHYIYMFIYIYMFVRYTPSSTVHILFLSKRGARYIPAGPAMTRTINHGVVSCEQLRSRTWSLEALSLAYISVHAPKQKYLKNYDMLIVRLELDEILAKTQKH